MITMTTQAIEHIKTLMQGMPTAIGFRLSIKKTGCNGYAYVPELITEINPDDIHIMEQALDVYIDPTIKDLLQGTDIDYVEKQFGQKQMVFNNPNAKGECGCGESFNIEDAS